MGTSQDRPTTRHFWTRIGPTFRRRRCSCCNKKIPPNEDVFVIMHYTGWLRGWDRIVYCKNKAEELGWSMVRARDVHEYPGT